MHNRIATGIVRLGTPKADPRALPRWMGYTDFRLGRGYSKVYEKMTLTKQRNYERGRCLAATLLGSHGMVPAWPSDRRLQDALIQARLELDVIVDYDEENQWHNSLARTT